MLASNGLNESYAYDAFGNMVSAGNFNFQQAYTTANQLSGWVYDAAGNLLNNGLGDVFTYDAEERISTMGGNTYVYDAEGSRVAKTGSSAIDYISFGGRQIARLAGGQWTDLIYGVSGLLAEVPGTQAGTPVYRMLDHLGSVAGTLNSNGTLLSSMDYAPFGQIFAGGTADPYVFTGKERDTESGNDYFGARYYASSMGRYMSPDYNEDDLDPIPYADLSDPQTMNLYGYAENNPLSNIDVDGHVSCPDGKAQDVVCAVQTALQWIGSLFGGGSSNNGNGDTGTHVQNSDPNFTPQLQTRPNYMIRANRGTLNLYQTSPTMYRRVGTYTYQTGRDGHTNPADVNYGPLPPGSYTLYPSEISPAGFFRHYIDQRDWGDYRVPLHPDAGTNAFGRSGFFLHGGHKRPGSEGCLKVNCSNQNDLFIHLLGAGGPVPLTEQNP